MSVTSLNYTSAFSMKVLPCVLSAKTEVPYAKQLSAQSQRTSGSSGSGTSFKLQTAATTSPSSSSLDVTYEFFEETKLTKRMPRWGGPKIIIGILFFPLKYNHCGASATYLSILQSNPEPPILSKSLGGTTILQFQDLKFRLIPPQAVMQLLKMQSAHGSLRRGMYFGEGTWSLHCFFYYTVRGKLTLSISQPEWLHETHIGV